MPILDLNNKKEVERYNHFIKNQEETNVMQTIEWGKLKKGWGQEIVFIEENELIKMSAMILIKKEPISKKSLLYVPRGPIGDIYNIELFIKLLKEIETIRKKYKAFMIRFDPAIKYDKDLIKILKQHKFKVRNKNAKDIIQPRYNFIVPVCKEYNNDELLFENFSSSTRRNIKIAIKKGCTVEIDNSIKSLEEFYELHEITGIRDNFIIRQLEYYKNLLEIYDKDTVKIFKIKLNEEVLASSITIKFGNKLWYMVGASGNNNKECKPSYLLQYYMIKYAIETNCKFYELGGVYYPDSRDSVYDFKSRFSKKTKILEYIGEIDYVYDKAIYYLFVGAGKRIVKLKNKTISYLKSKKRKSNSIKEYV
ncbi:MAG: peptidoglycan bridge formation glycyltransferase FemA/FemB family protein [Clostridia bacterium]